jgi:hypothetical protein
MINLDYVKEQRGLKFVKKEMKVQSTYSMKFGIIKSGNESGNLNVLFDGEKQVDNCHPTWCMRYFDADGNVLAEYGE